MAVEKYFDRLQMVYQTMNLTVVRTAIGPWLDDRAREWQACLERVGKSLVMDPPPHDVTCEFDPHYLALALDAMVAWRAKRSDGSEARFTWGAIGDDLIMEWREEGLGTTARSSDLDDATTGGSHCSQDSASVTMVVLKRIVATHGGTVSCSRDQDFRLQLRWPTRQRVSPNA